MPSDEVDSEPKRDAYDQLSKLARWVWMQFRSRLGGYPIPKENGFAEWWAAHHSEFAGLTDSQAKSIYDAGQQATVAALREVRTYLENAETESMARIEKMAEGSKWRLGSEVIPPSDEYAKACLVYEGDRIACQCSSPATARQIVQALAHWDIKTGFRMAAPEYECPMCGAPTNKEKGVA